MQKYPHAFSAWGYTFLQNGRQLPLHKLQPCAAADTGRQRRVDQIFFTPVAQSSISGDIDGGTEIWPAFHHGVLVERNIEVRIDVAVDEQIYNLNTDGVFSNFQ